MAFSGEKSSYVTRTSIMYRNKYIPSVRVGICVRAPIHVYTRTHTVAMSLYGDAVQRMPTLSVTQNSQVYLKTSPSARADMTDSHFLYCNILILHGQIFLHV